MPKSSQIKTAATVPKQPLILASAGRGGHLFVLRTLEQSGVVGGVHGEGGFRGDGGGAAATSGPSVRMQELAGVVGAVAEARPVEALVGPVHLLCRVTLHEQVHRHDTSRLGGRGGSTDTKLTFIL